MKTSLELINIIVLNVGFAKTKHHWGNYDISSPFARIYYAKKGRAWLHLPDKEIVVTPGHMYLVPTFVPHSYECEPDFEFYYMFVYERYQDKSGIFDQYEFPFEVKANEAVDLLFTNYCSLYPQLSLPYASADDFCNHPAYRDYALRYSQMQHYERMQLQGLVWTICSYFMKHAKIREAQEDSRIKKVLDFCQCNVGNEVTIDMLTDIACVTKSHLMRIFRDKVGISPLQYIQRKKIQTAQGLLLTTDMSVRQISEKTGFNDSSYFIRTFKKHIGFTPQEYRVNLK